MALGLLPLSHTLHTRVVSWQALVVARVGQSADAAQKSHIETFRSDLFWYQSARFQYLL